MVTVSSAICKTNNNTTIISLVHEVKIDFFQQIVLNTVRIKMILQRKVRLNISMITKQFFANFISTESLSCELFKGIISIQNE